MGVEEEQQIAVLGEVVVVAESLVKGRRSGRRGRCSSWCWLVVRWSGGGWRGAVELRWRGRSGGTVELRWRAATPGLAAAAAGGEEDGDWGIEVPGLPHDGV